MTETDVPTPSLYEVTQMAEDAGLVQEKDTALVVFISCIHGGFVWMRSESRSGKDQVVDAVEYCLPNGGGFGVFDVPSSTSKTALYKEAHEMNNKKIHRYPDIASLPEHIEAILKKHGEGEPITHSFATGTDAGETEGQTIYPPDAFILFHASDNEKVDPDEYPELRNRALMVSVDAGEELTKAVNERQAFEEAGLYDENVTSERGNEIRDYIRTIPKDTYVDGVGQILNPVAPAINEQNPLPQKFVEARQDFQRLLKFMRSITLFHHKERMKVIEDGEAMMLVTPADAWLSMRIFGEEMILSALNLRDRDLSILKFLREDMKQGWSKAGIHQELRDVGLNVSDRDVATSLKGMMNKGYVKKDDSQSPVLWSATPFAAQVDSKVNLDWSEVVDYTEDIAHEALSEERAEEYVERFCQGEGLLVRNPYTGETVDITEASGLEEAVEEQMEVEKEVIEDAAMDSDDTEAEQEEPESGQGTLGGQIGA